MSHRLLSQKTIDLILQPNPLVAEMKQRIAEDQQESSMTDLKIVEGDETEDFSSWCRSGFYLSGAVPSEHDLISEWKEPRKGECTLVVCEGSGGRISHHCYASYEAAERAHDTDTRKVIAILGSIPWTEGQGLDGEGSE